SPNKSKCGYFSSLWIHLASRPYISPHCASFSKFEQPALVTVVHPGKRSSCQKCVKKSINPITTLFCHFFNSLRLIPKAIRIYTSLMLSLYNLCQSGNVFLRETGRNVSFFTITCSVVPVTASSPPVIIL